MLFVRYAATALFIVAVPVFLVLTNVRVAATDVEQGRILLELAR